LINGLAAAGILTSLAAGSLGFASNAEARVVGGRYTDRAIICGWIQDEYDSTLLKFRAAKAGSAEYYRLARQLGNLDLAWYEQDCHETFGDLHAAEPAVNPHIVTTSGVLHTSPLVPQ
jgi:hypothetical protein